MDWICYHLPIIFLRFSPMQYQILGTGKGSSGKSSLRCEELPAYSRKQHSQVGGQEKKDLKKKIISGTSDFQVSKTGDTPVEKREIYPGQSRSSQCWEQLLSACHGENSGLNKIYQGPESKWGDTRKLKQNKNSTAALNPSSWDVKQKNFPHLQKLVAQL